MYVPPSQYEGYAVMLKFRRAKNIDMNTGAWAMPIGVRLYINNYNIDDKDLEKPQ